MIRVALTGGIATGKSYVTGRLRGAGVPVVDADVLAREAVSAGSSGLAAVVDRFGRDILTSSGDLDRAKLGEIVFRDPAARQDLEEIIHPIVRARILEFFESLSANTDFAVADIPLLFETGREKTFDKVIVVACAPSTQLARVMKRDGLSREAAERRLAAQMPIDDKVKRADFVIRTDGTHAETDAQIATVVESLRSWDSPLRGS